MTGNQETHVVLDSLKCLMMQASKKAIQELDGATVEGRTIKVMEAKPKEDRSSRGGNGGRAIITMAGSYNKNRY